MLMQRGFIFYQYRIWPADSYPKPDHEQVSFRILICDSWLCGRCFNCK
jgi:hypothetical protein